MLKQSVVFWGVCVHGGGGGVLCVEAGGGADGSSD